MAPFPNVKGLEGAKEIANADNYPNIRLFTVKRYYSQTPLIELEDENILQHWSNASKGLLKFEISKCSST